MKVFAYWDRPATVPAYLQLCLATWQLRGGIDELSLLTDANLHQWLAAGVLDLEALREYPLPQRKDAIEIAILALYGGLFLDLDTLCAQPPLALPGALGRAEVALYGFHVAAVAARPGSAVARRWLELLQQTLRLPRSQIMAATGRDYTELGNYTFELLRDELATGRQSQPGIARGRLAQLHNKWRRYRMLHQPGQAWIAQLDPNDSGYIAEHGYRRRQLRQAAERYCGFWFDRELPLDAVTRQQPELVALHHSWTPPEYAALGFDELAQDQSLLSRYLRHLLGDIDPAQLTLVHQLNHTGASPVA